jgi:holin-like protein
MVKGIFIILLFYFIGQVISYLISGFIPGSIIGMMLLFVCLCLKVKGITVENVRDVANTFTKNMAIFFIPAGAGLLGSFGLISKFWMSILIICSVSTILVIIVVALVQQQMEKRKK